MKLINVVSLGMLFVFIGNAYSSTSTNKENVSYRVSDHDTAPWIGNLEGAEAVDDKVICLYRSGERTAYYVTKEGVCHKYAVMTPESAFKEPIIKQ